MPVRDEQMATCPAPAANFQSQRANDRPSIAPAVGERSKCGNPHRRIHGMRPEERYALPPAGYNAHGSLWQGPSRGQNFSSVVTKPSRTTGLQQWLTQAGQQSMRDGLTELKRQGLAVIYD